jgi:hypothetical protein
MSTMAGRWHLAIVSCVFSSRSERKSDTTPFCSRRLDKNTENTNGLLRDLFPKGRSLDGAADAEVNAAYAMLNRRPRKRLGWKYPQEVFCSQALHLL